MGGEDDSLLPSAANTTVLNGGGEIDYWRMIAEQVMQEEAEEGEGEEEEDDGDGDGGKQQEACAAAATAPPPAAQAERQRRGRSQSELQAPDFTAAQLSRLRAAHPLSSPVARPAATLESEYELLEEIGAGGFGRTLRARHATTNALVAVKRVDLTGLAPFDRALQAVEVRVLASLTAHPNIVRFVDVFGGDVLGGVDGGGSGSGAAAGDGGGTMSIVMEFCKGGDLLAELKRAAAGAEADRVGAQSPLGERRIMDVFVQLLAALHHVHGVGVLHRDVKASNVFLAADGATVKLGDFGVAKILGAGERSGAGGSGSGGGGSGERAHAFVGTPNYVAPELCRGRPYGAKADVWALGCLVHEMASLKPAFKGSSQANVFARILRGRRRELPPEYAATQLPRLVDWMLQQKPGRRPTTGELLADDYVAEHVARLRAERPQWDPPLPSVAELKAVMTMAEAAGGEGGAAAGGRDARRLSSAARATLAWLQRPKVAAAMVRARLGSAPSIGAAAAASMAAAAAEATASAAAAAAAATPSSAAAAPSPPTTTIAYLRPRFGTVPVASPSSIQKGPSAAAALAAAAAFKAGGAVSGAGTLAAAKAPGELQAPPRRADAAGTDAARGAAAAAAVAEQLAARQALSALKAELGLQAGRAAA